MRKSCVVRTVLAVIVFDGDIEESLQIYEDLFQSVWPSYHCDAFK